MNCWVVPGSGSTSAAISSSAERRLLDLCHHVINNDEIQMAKEFNKPFTENASFRGLDLLKLKGDEWE